MPTNPPTQQIVRVLNVGQIARGLPITFNALPGIVGTPGPQGPPGADAFTTLTNAFTMPLVGASVNITVADAQWLAGGASIYIQGAGYFTVQSVFDAQHATVVNAGSPGNANPGTVIMPNVGVSAAGAQGGVGPAGPTGSVGPPGPAGPQGTGIIYRGNWVSTTAYAINDSVTYGGSSYVALKTSTGVVPGTDPTTWNIFAQQGATGATGAPGAAGGQGPPGTTGPAGPASTTTTSAAFTQPAVNATVSVVMANTAWIPIGSVVYIVGGGYYIVTAVPDATHATLENTGWTGNATPGSSVSSGALVAAGGVAGANGAQGATGPVGPQGVQGTAGANAYAILQSAFTVPVPGSLASIGVDHTNWMSVGLYIFITGAGYYQINSIVGATSITAINMGYAGNAAAGSTITGGAYIYPGGAPQTINREYYKTDFENGWADWSITTPSGGSTSLAGQFDPDSQGILVGMSAVGVSNWFASMGIAGAHTVQIGNRVTFIHAKVMVPTLSTGTDTFGLYLGWQSAQAINFQDGIFFYYTSGGSTAGHWGCYARRAGAQVYSDSGVVVQTGYWYDLEVTIDQAFATFSIASYAQGATPTAPVIVAQIAISQIPAAGTGLGPQFTVSKTAGTSVAGTLYVDAYEHEILYAGAPKFKMPAMVGPKGLDVTTGTTASFLTPVSGSNVTIAVLNSGWMVPGQTVYISGAGAYQVVSLPDATHAIVQNLGSTGNTASNTVISAGASVVASGVAGPQGVLGPVGPQGPVGQTAATTLTSSFAQPAIQATVNIAVVSTAWMVPNSIIYINSGGYYTVNSVPSSTTATITNMGVTGNASPAATVLNNSLVGAAGFQGAPGSGPTPVGCVMLYGANTLPQGWLNCDGSPQTRTTYPELFTALGGVNSPWGIPDQYTFNLPDLRSRVPVCQGQGAGLTNRVVGAVGGEELHALSLAEMPSHNHSATSTSSQADHYHAIPASGNHTHTVPIGGVAQYAGGGIGGMWSTGPATTTSASGNIGPTNTSYASATGIPSVTTTTTIASVGGGSSHNIMQPFAVMSYIIKVTQETLVAGPVVPPADTTQNGLLRKVSGLTTDYVAGDNACHDLPTAIRSAMAVIQVRNFNALGNHNFEVDARTNGVGITAGAGSVNAFAQDRWACNKAGPLTATLKQTDASAAPVLLPGTNFAITRSFHRITITTAEPTLGATDYLALVQYVEGTRLRELISDVHSISLLVRCSIAFSFGVILRDVAGTHSLSKLGTISTPNSWTVISLANAALWTPSATWSLNPGVQGYLFAISLACGSTYLPPANDTWQNGSNFLGAVGQGNLAATSGAVFDIAVAQHEPGSVCNPFIDMPWDANYEGTDGTVRYYCSNYAYGTAKGTANQWHQIGQTVTGTAGRLSARFPKAMAKTPTVTAYGVAGNINQLYVDGVGDSACGAPTGDSTGLQTVTFNPAFPAGGIGNAILGNYIADTGW